jgi:hypothetical protein
LEQRQPLADSEYDSDLVVTALEFSLDVNLAAEIT